MDFRKTVATNLRSLMHHADIRSQAQLAKLSGVSQTQIGNILRCQKSSSIDLLDRLANGLNCEPWLLLVPTHLLEVLRAEDFLPLVYCYSILIQRDRNAVWKMTHKFFESTEGFVVQ